MRKKAGVVIRCDASPEVGLGHLMRCLAIARHLNEHTIVFAAAPDSSNVHITAAGYRLITREGDECEESFVRRAIEEARPDVVVLDTKYPYDAAFIGSLRRRPARVVVLDDLCPGLVACDAVVFPNAHLDQSLLPAGIPDGVLRTGLDYVIIREAVLAQPIREPGAGDPVIAVTTGGSDPSGVLLKILPFLAEQETSARINVLVGEAFKHRAELEQRMHAMPANIVVMPYDMEAIAAADVVICTFGMSIYEMIFLRKPTICISHDRDNARAAQTLADRYGAIEDLGFAADLSRERFQATVARLLESRNRTDLARRCSGLIDGRGAERVACVITGEAINDTRQVL